ncbi:MAG: hypothetical protein M0C28_25830 [Candidatus Moduliflexus flocculans]|nr:hypothetical protein [Candidatus Moduliflexus flocculans]
MKRIKREFQSIPPLTKRLLPSSLSVVAGSSPETYANDAAQVKQAEGGGDIQESGYILHGLRYCPAPESDFFDQSPQK